MFSEKLYQSVLTTLESARSNANMQHTYVAAFVEPSQPQTAHYPRGCSRSCWFWSSPG
jgi:capsule polysaccharide export protein KpsE/RkpR